MITLNNWFSFVFRYCKGTKENEISECTKSVLNDEKWAKYGKNGENKKDANNW